MIHSLSLRNFKCFEEQTLEFGVLTLLSGLNGTGKSSVLQSLLLLRQSYHQGLLKKDGLALNGELVSLGTAKDVFFEGASGDEDISFTVVVNNIEAYWHFKYGDPESDVIKLSRSQMPQEVDRDGLFTDNFHYLHAERLGPRSFFEKSDFQVRQHRQLGARGEYTAHFLSLFEEEKISDDRLRHPNESSDRLKSQVEAWLSEISPGVRINLVQNLDTNVVSLRYEFRSKDGFSNPYKANNVGFGLTYTLSLLVAILSSPPDALILIENPEAHLHPKGQSRMGDLFARAASCGIQVVVETHSDHVLNGIRLAVHAGRLNPDDVRLHFFTRNEQRACSEVISPRINTQGRIDRWPDGFFDEWDKSLEALLGSTGGR